MKKSMQKNEMDSAAALIEGLWPLENEDLGTAVVEEHERERLEWHEPPLVGADVIGGLPEGVSFEIEECKKFELGQLMTDGDDQWKIANGEGGIKFCDAVLFPRDGKHLAPMYEALNEIQEEVAKNIEESMLGVDIDPNEDFDVDDLLGILEELDSGGVDFGGSRSIPIGAQILPVPCQPSPVPSFSNSDSGIESSISDSVHFATDSVHFATDSGIQSNTCNSGIESPTSNTSTVFAVTADVEGFTAVEDVGGFGSEDSYATIDLDALQLIHLEDVEGGEECGWNAMDTCHKSGDASSNLQRCLEEENPEEVMDSTSRRSTSTSEFAFNDSPSGYSSVEKIHSYALKLPEEEKSVGKNGGRKRKKEEVAINLKKTKKKEQNKTAAQRYRMKKKMESGSVVQEQQEEERRNKELKSTVAALEGEIKYLKDLMEEFRREAALRGAACDGRS